MSMPKARRIAVAGFRAVGKSSVTVQFVEGHFIDSYFPTIENTFTKQFKTKNQDYLLEIIDTAGHDEFSLLSQNHALGIHGYVLVYSITSRSSMDLLKVIRDKILNFTGSQWVPCVLVGNKKDLEHQRQVSEEEARELANEWQCAYIECSAKCNQNIVPIFELMMDEIEKVGSNSASNLNQQKNKQKGNCIIS